MGTKTVTKKALQKK